MAAQEHLTVLLAHVHAEYFTERQLAIVDGPPIHACGNRRACGANLRCQCVLCGRTCKPKRFTVQWLLVDLLDDAGHDDAHRVGIMVAERDEWGVVDGPFAPKEHDHVLLECMRQIDRVLLILAYLSKGQRQCGYRRIDDGQAGLTDCNECCDLIGGALWHGNEANGRKRFHVVTTLYETADEL